MPPALCSLRECAVYCSGAIQLEMHFSVGSITKGCAYLQ